jgi:class 3 adenylate cyclase
MAPQKHCPMWGIRFSLHRWMLPDLGTGSLVMSSDTAYERREVPVGPNVPRSLNRPEPRALLSQLCHEILSAFSGNAKRKLRNAKEAPKTKAPNANRLIRYHPAKIRGSSVPIPVTALRQSKDEEDPDVALKAQGKVSTMLHWKTRLIGVPLYMDIHRFQDVTHDVVEKCHITDLEAAERFQARYLKYWYNQADGHVFCLIEAPTRDAAVACHVGTPHPEVVIEVQPSAVEGFLGSGKATPLGAALSDQPGETFDRGVRTILFTDIEGSTELLDRHGDKKAVELLRQHNAIIDGALARFGGRKVKNTGDGVMAAFASASSAVACAIEIQRAFAARAAGATDDAIRVRIGLSAGEPIEDDDDLFGMTVHLAARTCAHAKGEQILVSTAVAELCLGKNFAFTDRGEVPLKGFARPVRLYEVGWA